MQRDRLISAFRRLARMAAVLTAICSIVATLGFSHHGVELLSHFRLQYFVASVLLVVIYALWRKSAAAIVLVAIATLNAYFVLPWYFANDEAPLDAAAERTNVKVVHANVHSSNSNYQRLLEFIAEEDPDLILLQEMTDDWVAGTASLSGSYPFSYTAPRNGNFGIAAFSKIAFDTITHIDSPPLGYPTIVAELTVGDQPVTVIASHPTIPLGSSLSRSRNVQIEHIADLVESARGRVILAGDFNASVWDSHFVRLENDTELRNVRRGFGVLPSWPTFMPPAMIPIDHMLVSDDIRVVDAELGQRIGSDHLPLVVTLSL